MAGVTGWEPEAQREGTRVLGCPRTLSSDVSMWSCSSGEEHGRQETKSEVEVSSILDGKVGQIASLWASLGPLSSAIAK